MQNGPKGPSCAVCCVEALSPGLAPLVDRHGGSRGGGHLHAMRLAAEVVGDIPEVGTGLVGRRFATLDIPGLDGLPAAVATDVGAYCGPCDSPAGGGDILAPSVTDLVAQNATYDGAGNRSGHVDAASLLSNFFGFDPASLLGCSKNRAHRRDVRLIQPLVVATVEVMGRNGLRGIAVVVGTRVDVHGPHR